MEEQLHGFIGGTANSLKLVGISGKVGIKKNGSYFWSAWFWGCKLLTETDRETEQDVFDHGGLFFPDNLI